MNLISSWSGGKDSCYALMLALKDSNNRLSALMNMLNENGDISRSHGIALCILEQQANALGVPLTAIPTTWQDYENFFIKHLTMMKTTYYADAVVFGDIDIDAHKAWEEKVCSAADLTALLPLWQQQRHTLVHAMIDAGIEAIITSCNTELGEEFLGKKITRSTVQALADAGVDVCGENGEYHTLVVNCPLYKKPIQLPNYKKVTHEHYCFLVWDDEALTL